MIEELYVCSLSQAIHLKRIGMQQQNSMYYWHRHRLGFSLISARRRNRMGALAQFFYGSEFFAAFTAGEMAEMLKGTDGIGYMEGPEMWYLMRYAKRHGECIKYYTTFTQALASKLTHAIENGELELNRIY